MKTLRHIIVKNKNKVLVSVLLITLLLFSINVVSVNNKTNAIKSKILINGVIKLTIDKTTTDDEISSIMTSLKEQDIIAEFKNIERNENNEITSIKINITKNGSTSSYNASSNLGINTILIDIDLVSIHDKGIQIFGNRSMVNDEEITKMMQMQSDLFKSHFYDVESLKEMMQQQGQLFSGFDFEDNEDNAFDLFFTNKNNNKISGLINEDNYNFHEETKSKYIVNGIEITKEEYDKMDKSKINSLEIKKETVKFHTK